MAAWAKVGVLLSAALQDVTARVDALVADKVFDITKIRRVPLGLAGIPSGQVMQAHAFDPVSQQWFVASPTGTSPETLRVHRLTAGGNLIDTMTLTGAGHGYQIDILNINGVPTLHMVWQAASTAGNDTYSLVSFPYAGGTTIDRNDASITKHNTLVTAGTFIVVAYDWGNNYIATRIGGNPLTYTLRKVAELDAGVDNVIGQVGGIDNTSRQYQGHTTLGDNLYVLTGESTSDRLIWVYSWSSGQLITTINVNDMGQDPDGTEPGPLEPEGITSVTDPTTGLSSIVAGVAAGSAPRDNMLYQWPQTGQANLATLDSGRPLYDKNFRIVGDPGEVGFQGAWVNLSLTSYQKAAFQLLPSGMVVVAGYVKGGARGETMFTLPAGYRPPFLIRQPVFLKDAGDAHPGLMTISAAGALYLSSDSINGTGTIAWVDLSPISFMPGG